MTNCAKCGAELIGSRKFCAACGAPTDPASLKRDASVAAPQSSPAPAQQINVPSTTYGPPVNPFAATASPSSRAVGTPYGPPPATTANPPSNPPGASPGGDSQKGTPVVSPLAVSNALSQRGAFQQAAGDMIPDASVPGAPASSPTGPGPRQGTGTSPPPPVSAKKAPGTQLMPSIPNPGSSPPGSKPPPQRTQLMDASAFVRPGAPAAQAPSGSIPVASQQAPSAPQPPSTVHQAPVAYPPPPPARQPPYAHGWGGWGTPAGFGYAPGARVVVTWSNGQRYPATVSQTSGTQCLVVFPDGQQHWVEMQYVAPA